MRRLCVLPGLLALSGLAALSGCGAESGVPEVLAPASGTVLLENQPTAGISLSFLPADGGTAGTGGYAVTDADGKFTVKHRTGVEGIEPGSYKVVLSRFLMPDGSAVPPDESATDVGAVESLPAIYSDPESTTVTATIPAEGKADLSFQLSAN